MLKRTLRRAALGFLIGIIVGDGIAIFFSSVSAGSFSVASKYLIDRLQSPGPALLLQSLLSGIHGSVCFAGISMYEIEGWSMLRSALLHCFTILVSCLAVSKTLCWITTIQDALFMGAFIIVGYLIIWFILYAVNRAQVQKLNTLQEERRHEQESKMPDGPAERNNS